MEKKRNCYVFLSNGFSDWEAALLVAGLNHFTDFRVIYFSSDGQPVRSSGGMQVTPDINLNNVKAGAMDLLVLPGGHGWARGDNDAVKELVDAAVRQSKPVAAICDATVFLARLGHLNAIRHTSNHIMFLQEVGDAYQGEDWYVNKPCIRDGNIITASGTAGVEFAGEVFRCFDLPGHNDQLAFWFGFFQSAVESKEQKA